MIACQFQRIQLGSCTDEASLQKRRKGLVLGPQLYFRFYFILYSIFIVVYLNDSEQFQTNSKTVKRIKNVKTIKTSTIILCIQFLWAGDENKAELREQAL